MPDVLLGGMGGTELVQSLERILVDAAPAVIGIASAFVSVLGVELTKAVIDDAGIEGCRLVAGALSVRRAPGWRIVPAAARARAGASAAPRSHPR